MTSDRWHVALVLGVILGLLAGFALGRSAAATAPPHLEPVTTWRPVETGTPHAPPATATLAAGVPSGEGGSGSTPGAAVPFPPSPAAASAQPTASVAVPVPDSAPTSATRTTSASGHSVTGTFYCRSGLSRCTRGYPDRPGIADLYAAISPDLSRLRGKAVTVCRLGRCVTVRIIDCNCQATKAIDLYADAFSQLASLKLGRISVFLVQ